MNVIQTIAEHAAAITRGVVTDVTERGIVVALEHGTVECTEALEAGVVTQPVRAGDSVMLWLAPGDNAVLLGRVGSLAAGAGDALDEVVLEARQSLTLRVGDGSITIREDGRILIKGKDLVSHAKRMNRIRGGSVQIN